MEWMIGIGIVLSVVVVFLWYGSSRGSAVRTCKSIYSKAKKRRPNKAERDYLKMVLLTRPPFDYQHDKVINLILDKCCDVDSLADHIAHFGRGPHSALMWRQRDEQIKMAEFRERFDPAKRNEDFFRQFWN